MGNTGKIIVALIGVGAVGYTIYDYATTGSFWWDKLIMKYRATPQQNQNQLQTAYLQREVTRLRQEVQRLKPPPSVSKYQIEADVARGTQPTQKPIQSWS